MPFEQAVYLGLRLLVVAAALFFFFRYVITRRG